MFFLLNVFIIEIVCQIPGELYHAKIMITDNCDVLELTYFCDVEEVSQHQNIGVNVRLAHHYISSSSWLI